MKFNFQNHFGETLSGRLETPTGTPAAYALFAHCFTCSKDIIAASIISKKLTESGIAVLRFDFTGLGNSDGDFANTNFSSNVDDLISAYRSLTQQFEAPQILIGHSLGGAAVLKAAQQLSSVKAVVTIGAPSCTEHVSHLFKDNLETIKKEGKAQVQLAGREFTIKKQFIDDLNKVEIIDGIKNFKKALLVLHSPIDNRVSIDHAAEIFLAAKHPKSFISLDSADHLLFNRSDAEYAAKIIGAWVSKYIDNKKGESIKVEKGSVSLKNRKGTKFTNDIYTSKHHIVADEPRSIGGNDLGLSPYELLLSGLGACTSMTLKMYAERKNINLESIQVDLRHSKIHAEDCNECETEKGMIDQIEKHIQIEGQFTPEQKQRLYEIAERCPVNRTLLSEVSIKSSHEK